MLEDLENGAQFQVEASRLSFYHSKSMIELLKISDYHLDAEQETESV